MPSCLFFQQANEGDALAAILLFEECVTLHSGFSLFDVLPLHHLLAPDPSFSSTSSGEDDSFDAESRPEMEDVFDAESWLGAGNDVIMARLAERIHAVLDTLPDIHFGRDI